MEIIKVETVERVVSVTTSTEPREAIITVQPFQPREIKVEGSHVVVGIPGKDGKDGEKGDDGEGIENFEADLSLLYQIAKL